MVVLRAMGPWGFEPNNGGASFRLVESAQAPLRELRVDPLPFLVGRAQDCQLVLPKNESLRALTSRWHCHFAGSATELMLVDGSAKTIEDYGGPKPSATGTFLNGNRITGPTRVKDGDEVGIGPWRFQVAMPKTGPVELIDLLSGRSKTLQQRRVEATDPRLKEKFGHLHELVHRLAQTPSIEEALTALLSYAADKIAPAEVAAVLTAAGPGKFKPRLAWQKGVGTIRDFRFSESLIKSMAPDQTYLLTSKLKDPSVSQNLNDINSGLILPLWGKGDRLGVLYMDNRRTGRTFTEEDLYLASAIASLVSLQLALERQTELTQVEANMARYFAPDVVQRILQESASNRPVALEVQERDVTVAFVDMEGFTVLSRLKSPREVGEILNAYLECVALRIQAGGGHVNKFIGDCVLGIFGAQPVEVAPSHPGRYAAQAVQTALDLPLVWEAERARRKFPPIRMRIGINSGRAVVGNIGYASRLEYSVLGDAVNIASRLEKLAPPNRAAVSESTKSLVSNLFAFDDLGEKEVRDVGMMRLFSPTRPL